MNTCLIFNIKISVLCRFCVGDRFYLCENKILCEYDYEERLVFANMATYNSSSLAHIRRQVSRLQVGHSMGRPYTLTLHTANTHTHTHKLKYITHERFFFFIFKTTIISPYEKDTIKKLMWRIFRYISEHAFRTLAGQLTRCTIRLICCELYGRERLQLPIVHTLAQ